MSNTPFNDVTIEPHAKIKQLIERLTGRWRVTGPGIDGEAEYWPVKGESVLVAHVDFINEGTKMKIIQHIAYDERTDTLRARYMDTMGDESVYTWVLDGQEIRVSLGGEDSATYFAATLSDDNSEYIGTWHYPDRDEGQADRIEYRRI